MKKVSLLAVLILFLFAGSALANPQVYLKETGVSPMDQGTVHFPALGNVGGVQYGLYQLAIDWDKAGSGSYVAISGFCVEDAYSTSADGVTYELLTITDTKYKQAAWLMDNYLNGNASAQATQLAIWEVVLETSDIFNVSNGQGVMYATFGNTYVTDANALFANIVSNFDASAYKIAHSPVDSNNPSAPQDYIIKVQVPEPASLLLLGFSLLALAGIGRKKFLG